MTAIYDLKERICDELDDILRSGKMDMAILDKVDKMAAAAYHLSKLASAEEDSGRRHYSRRTYAVDTDGITEKLERMMGSGNDQEREIARRLLTDRR